LVWGRIIPNQSPNYLEIDGVQSPSWLEISPSQSANYEDIAA
jgi:hypothetical protein